VALAITTCIASINVSYRLCPQGQTDGNSIGMLLLSLSHQSSTCRTDCGSLSGNLAAVAYVNGPTTGLEFACAGSVLAEIPLHCAACPSGH